MARSQLAQLNDLQCKVIQGDSGIGIVDAEAMTALLSGQIAAGASLGPSLAFLPRATARTSIIAPL